MKTLIVNTYAGSLLLGANSLKDSRIIGSYEDCGFGASITKANRGRFDEAEPDFHFIDHIKQWPDQDLSNVVILAHPPCAAFSQQNVSPTKRGVNTDAFECTRKVLKYGMTNNVAAMAIESVPGALAGAWDVYDNMAEAGGYHVYRILKNSLLFGVPQYRERFWAVLVRKGLSSPEMTWTLSPRFTHVSATIDHLLPGAPVYRLDESVSKFVNRLVREHGFVESDVRSVGLAHQSGHKRRSFSYLITQKFFPGQDYKVICRKHISPFSSGQPSVLAPYGYTPVLLGSSLWIYQGAPVSEEGYKAIMGFPPDYLFPEGTVRHHMRTYLSKGVCPPVATWVLDNVRGHLGLPMTSEFTRADGWVKEVQPGRIASFRPSKVGILKKMEQMEKFGAVDDDELIPLRNEEEDLES